MEVIKYSYIFGLLTTFMLQLFSCGCSIVQCKEFSCGNSTLFFGSACLRDLKGNFELQFHHLAQGHSHRNIYSAFISKNCVFYVGATVAGLNPWILCQCLRRRCLFPSRRSNKEGLWKFSVLISYFMLYSVISNTQLQQTALFSTVPPFILV